MNPVTSILNGGLGNQLFQFAAARALALRLETDVRLDQRRLLKRGLRTYALDDFALNEQVSTICEGRLPEDRSKLRRTIAKIFAGKNADPTFREADFAYDARHADIQQSVRLDGYFQSYKYFAPYAEAIRSDLTPRLDLRAEIEGKRSKLIPASSCVSMHVRRKDYTNPEISAVHGVLHPDYYARALSVMNALLPDPPIICVFTDDPQWVRDNLDLPPNARYISEQTTSAFEDFILMSRCDHHITANSSFSWWGAWLNPRSDKVVITPEQWFQPEVMQKLDISDLRPVEWLTV